MAAKRTRKKHEKNDDVFGIRQIKTTKIAEAFLCCVFFFLVCRSHCLCFKSCFSVEQHTHPHFPLALLIVLPHEICPNCDTHEQLFGNVFHHTSHIFTEKNIVKLGTVFFSLLCRTHFVVSVKPAAGSAVVGLFRWSWTYVCVLVFIEVGFVCTNSRIKILGKVKKSRRNMPRNSYFGSIMKCLHTISWYRSLCASCARISSARHPQSICSWSFKCSHYV